MLTSDATTEVVDGSADVVTGLDAGTGGVVIEVLGVTLGAVQVIHVLQTASRVGGGCRGN